MLGIAQSFYNLSALPQGALDSNVLDIDPAAWYPYATLLDLKSSVRKNLPTTANICFRAGMNFLRIWYEHDPGKDMVHSGRDWLHLHQEGGGYNSVVRGGRPEEIGWGLLQFIDEEAGIAVYENVSPLVPDFVNGVFYAGCLLFDDMEYVNVTSVASACPPNPLFTRSLITVQFRIQPKAAGGDGEVAIHGLGQGAAWMPSQEAVESLVWRYKGLQVKAQLEAAYYNDINVILAADGQCVEVNDAYAQLAGRTRAELAARNFHHIQSWVDSGVLQSSLEALATNLSQRHEAYIFTPCGTALYVEYCIHPILIQDQQHPFGHQRRQRPRSNSERSRRCDVPSQGQPPQPVVRRGF